MTTMVVGLGCPKNIAVFAFLRVLSHLVVIPSYLVFIWIGIPQGMSLFLFIALILVSTRLRQRFDPDGLTVLDNPDGDLRIHGKFKEMTIDQSSPFRLRSVGLVKEKLEFTLLRDGVASTVSVDGASFRPPRLAKLHDVLQAFLQGDIKSMRSQFANAGKILNHGQNELFIVNEPPGFGKVIFGSLGVALLILSIAYGVLFAPGGNA